MPFLSINGVELEVAVNTWKETREDIESFARGGDYSMQGALYAEKRVWTFDTPPMDPTLADQMKGWIEGRGHLWDFERADLTSDESGLTWTTAQASASQTQEKFGSYSMSVASAQSSTATSSIYGRRSWSLWKRPASGTGSGSWTHFAETYDGTTTISFESSATATLSGWFSSSNDPLKLTLEGRDNDDTDNTVSYYDAILMVPYVFTNSMVAALASRGSVLLCPPFVEMGGDCIEDTTTVPVRVKVESHDTIAVKGGETRRVLHVRIWER